jgi:hypothetical protein
MLTPDPVVVMHVQQHAEAWSRYTERMVYMQDAIATICHDDDTLSQSVLDVYVHSKGPIPVHVIPWLASLTADPKVHDALWNSDRGVLPVPTRVPYKATESSMAILMPMQHMPSWSQRHVESIMRSYATTGSDERLWGYELTPSSHPHRTGSGRVSQMLMASLARVGCSDEHVYAHIDQPKLHLALRAAITDRAMCMVMDAVGVTPVDCRRLADTIRHQGTAYPKSIMYRMMPHMADVDGALDVITALQAMAPDGATSEE